MIEICKFYEPPVGHIKIFKIGRIKIQAKYVPSGSFMMGSGSEHCQSNHSPKHKIEIKNSYWISTSPVSTIDYFKIIRPWSPLNLFVENKKSSKTNLKKEEIDYFLAELNKKNTSRYHWTLPTEPQWEYAAQKDMFDSAILEWTADNWYDYPRSVPAEEPHINNDYEYYDSDSVVIKTYSKSPHWRQSSFSHIPLRNPSFRLIKLYEKGDL